MNSEQVREKGTGKRDTRVKAQRSCVDEKCATVRAPIMVRKDEKGARPLGRAAGEGNSEQSDN